MPIPTGADLVAISPQLVLIGVATLTLLIDAFWPNVSKKALASFCVAGLIGTAILVWRLWPKQKPEPVMQGMLLIDGFTAFFTLVFLLGTALSILMSIQYLDNEKAQTGEYYALVMFATVGAVVMAASVNLICVFIGLEILSIALYILAGYDTARLRSDESALKYFLLGAFASAFFLYGIALIYGATGHIQLDKIVTALGDVSAGGGEPGKNFLILAGVSMLIIGFGFKVAVVPFHIWTPDVYEGAPTCVTAFMSVLAKAAGFAAFLRVMGTGLQSNNLQFQISAVLASVSALTMLVGNVVAVVQPGIKRMLAYSSIAHAGYMLTGVVAAVRPSVGGFAMLGGEARAQAVSAVLFYALAYTVSNLGAFAVILALRKKGREVDTISDLAGVGQQYPLLGILMALFMLSLAGFPPTAGFFAKLFIIRALVGMNSPLPWLLIVFALTSVVSFYYYLGVVRAMYFDSPDENAAERPRLAADIPLRLALGVTALGTIVLGLWAGGALSTAQDVANSFLNVTPSPFSGIGGFR